MRGKLGVGKDKYIREGGRATSEAVVRRPAVTTADAILYTCLTAGVFCKKVSPQGQVCIDHVVCHDANNRVASVIEGPEAIVALKGSLRECAYGICDISCGGRAARLLWRCGAATEVTGVAIVGGACKLEACGAEAKVPPYIVGEV